MRKVSVPGIRAQMAGSREHTFARDHLQPFDQPALQILDFGCFGLAQHRFWILDYHPLLSRATAGRPYNVLIQTF
jgi:hypothetical protein